MTSSSGIINQLIGKWQQVSSDNFDAFLAAAGENYYCIHCMCVLSSQRTVVQSAILICRVLAVKRERRNLHGYSIYYVCILKMNETFIKHLMQIYLLNKIFEGLMMMCCAATSARSSPWNQQPNSKHSLFSLVTNTMCTRQVSWLDSNTHTYYCIIESYHQVLPESEQRKLEDLSHQNSGL